MNYGPRHPNSDRLQMVLLWLGTVLGQTITKSKDSSQEVQISGRRLQLSVANDPAKYEPTGKLKHIVRASSLHHHWENC
jgi:hypothetical protein